MQLYGICTPYITIIQRIHYAHILPCLIDDMPIEVATFEEVDKIGARLGAIEYRLGKVETKVDRLDTKVDRLEERLDRLETKVDRLETKVDRLEERLDRLETKVDKIDNIELLQITMLEKLNTLLKASRG